MITSWCCRRGAQLDLTPSRLIRWRQQAAHLGSITMIVATEMRPTTLCRRWSPSADSNKRIGNLVLKRRRNSNSIKQRNSRHFSFADNSWGHQLPPRAAVTASQPTATTAAVRRRTATAHRMWSICSPCCAMRINFNAAVVSHLDQRARQVVGLCCVFIWVD